MTEQRLLLRLATEGRSVVIDTTTEAQEIRQALRLMFGSRLSNTDHCEDPAFTLTMARAATRSFRRADSSNHVLVSGSRLIDILVALRQGVSLWLSSELEHYHASVIRVAFPRRQRVIALLGASGSGKSQLIAAIARRTSVEVLVEDWGPIDELANVHADPLAGRVWHLKRQTAHLYGSLIQDMIADDPSDSDRAFYRHSSFAEAAVQLDGAVILGGQSDAVLPFERDDMAWIANGQWSDYYGQNETWLDGSTLLFGQTDHERRHQRMLALLERVPSIVMPGYPFGPQRVRSVLQWADV